MKKITIIPVLSILLIVFCNFNYVTEKKCYQEKKYDNEKLKIYIQPLGNVKQDYINEVKNSIESFYGFECIVKPKTDFSKDILTNSKKRYDASKILEKFDSENFTLVLTEKDIATVKGKYPEWGIFGLGYCPGKTCVVSTIRLKRNVTEMVLRDRISKVALHELGHNLGLNHCSYDIRCMMNDARGTIKQVDGEKVWLCNNCRNILKK